MIRSIFLLSFLVCFFARAQAQITVVINEVMSSNASTIFDEDLQFDDWIELYNYGSSAVSLGGLYITDNPALPMKFQIPPGFGASIPPGGYFLIWCDGTQPTPGFSYNLDRPFHANFNLSADGEPVLLIGPNGSDIIDQVDLGAQQTDISFGRTSDGAPTWQYFNNATPLAANMEVTQPNQFLVINEVLAVNQNNIFDEYYERHAWIEFYNPTNNQVNLAGYSISNGSVTYTVPNTNPVFTTIPANGFQIVYCDGQPSKGPNHTSFTLGPNNGTITLFGPMGGQVDQYNYTYTAPDVSWGRSSDGAPNSISFQYPTPRHSNTLVVIVPENVFINEVLTSNLNDITDEYGEHDDWFEIYNPNAFPVNLANYYISDNPYNPKKWKVPALYPDSVTVPAGGWLLFWADGQNQQGVRHTRFKLSSVQEELALRSPDGFTLADMIWWQNLRTDTSYGRLTDGNLPWVQFVQTTPDASNNGAQVEIQEVFQPEVLVYPNPVQNTLFLSRRMDVIVYDTRGKKVTSLRQVSEVDFSGFAPGLYMVSNQEGFIAKVIKQ
jgi:large repetitive protein